MQQPRLTVAGRLRGRPGYRIANRLEHRRFRRELPFRLDGDRARVVRRHDGRLQVADVDPAATGRTVADANLVRVLEVCERAGIEHLVVPEPGSLTGLVAVEAAGWDALLDGLAGLVRSGPVYVAAAGDIPRLAHESDVMGPLRDASAIDVFTPVATATDGRSVLGSEWACRVQRWTRDGAGRLVAGDRNARAAYVDAALADTTTIERAGRPVPTLSMLSARHVFDVDFPVDAVYLWVDGDDPQWRARKAAVLTALGESVGDLGAAADVRFRDGGELRYSLRSLAAYAPWIRRVFLVTDGQLPSWLDVTAPGLTVVDHRELFGDAGRLPTFNSHAIGARLHHLDGLAEHYLYVNDDVFFGRDVTPGTFFEANGTSKFFLSRSSLGFADDAARPAHESARRNVADLLQRDFGRQPTNIFYHSPIPQRRSTMVELEQRYPDEFARTWSNQFRSPSDIEPNSWLHHYYGYLTGRAVPAPIRYTYVDVGSATSVAQLTRLARTRDRDVFCLNDHVDATAADHAFAADWLARYFPVPSRFEKPSC